MKALELWLEYICAVLLVTAAVTTVAALATLAYLRLRVLPPIRKIQKEILACRDRKLMVDRDKEKK